MTFAEAEAFLDSLGIDAMKSLAPSLHRMEALCEVLDDPQRSVAAIHITGTNGKTSTARILSSVLSAIGLSVGTYTSPHLQSITERMTRDGVPISEDDFAAVFDHLRPYIELVEDKLDESLSYFEIVTAMFFLWAAEAPVDAMVVEVGMGGRWDATNVVPSRHAVITSIGLDHTKMLGDDVATIAKEKAGIIKQSATVVTGERHGSAANAIAAAAATAGATLVTLGTEFDLVSNTVAVDGRYLTVATSERTYEDLFLPLHGSHQGINAALALETAIRMMPADSLSEELVAQGLATASAPGRLETFGVSGAGSVVLDVAHNPDGMSALVSALAETFAFSEAIFVIGVLADKDALGMLKELARVPCRLVLTTPRSERAQDPQEMARLADELGLPHVIEPDVPSAMTRALQEASDDALVCVTGSHYVVGEARSHLMH